MKKILVISGIQVFPPLSGGHMRTTSICKSLVNFGYQVQLYSFTGRRNDYIQRKNNTNNNISANLYEYVNRSTIFGLVQYFFYKLNLPPIWLTGITMIAIPKNLKEMIENSNIVIIDFPYLYPIFKYVENKKVLNTHNVESEIFSSRLLKFIVYNIEKKATQKTNIALFCNDVDKKKLVHLLHSGSTTHIVPNGLNKEDYLIDKASREKIRCDLNMGDKKIMLFVGSNYPPNKEAYHLLVEWVSKNSNTLENNNIQILIVGSVEEYDPCLQNLKVLGFVDDILKYFSAADYAINCVISGSGTNVKMVQYIASHIPILTTEFGARGLNLKDKKECLFFTFNNLSEVIARLTKMSIIELEAMTQRAYINNQKYIDIDSAVARINFD